MAPPSPSVLRSWLKELLVTGAIVGAVVFFMKWQQAEGQRGGGGKLPVGTPAPTFSLTEVATGDAVALQGLQGKPVIVAFWATYCGPCRSELDDLEAVFRDAGDAYALVTVSRERGSTLRRFMRERGLSVPVLRDPDGRVHTAYGVSTIPTTVIIDREGMVVHDFTGAADGDILREHMQRL